MDVRIENLDTGVARRQGQSSKSGAYPDPVIPRGRCRLTKDVRPVNRTGITLTVAHANAVPAAGLVHARQLAAHATRYAAAQAAFVDSDQADPKE